MRSIIRRWKWFKEADRLGPDMLATHLFSYFPDRYKKICRKKFAHFDEGAEFRSGAYAVTCSNIFLGKNVVIRPANFLMADSKASINIEDDVLVGSGVHMYVANHRFSDVNKPIYYQGHTESKSIIIKKGAWIGANAVILPGVTVGENAVVGSGSIVTKDVPARCVVGGVPAKVIKYLT
ncbi:acyltransferase [Lysinibacillus sphaericus]|uniref:acyltransferase n=1 Tax=Lysinibacillus sphaericus TaxID=1421 RepID=UPI003CFE10F7